MSIEAPAASDTARVPRSFEARISGGAAVVPTSGLRAAVQGVLRHWLLLFNAALGLFLAGALAAPILAAGGASQAASWFYGVYHLACHQWAFRSFFLFGPSAVYSEDQLARRNVDPFAFIGSPELGYKMAVCERDVAIYAGLLAVGLLYARRTAPVPKPLSLTAYSVLILPMAVDGFTQLFGWRESTWELRVITGLIFGVASACLLLPRFEDALRPPHRMITRYAPAEPRAVAASVPPVATSAQPAAAPRPAVTSAQAATAFIPPTATSAEPAGSSAQPAAASTPATAASTPPAAASATLAGNSAEPIGSSAEPVDLLCDRPSPTPTSPAPAQPRG